MSGGQIAAVIFAALLLLPGGCFTFFGIGLASDTSDNLAGLGVVMLLIGVAILSLAGFLFWLAFRKRPTPPTSPSTP